MRKSLWIIPFLVAAAGAPAAHADTVQVGTVTIESALCASAPPEWCGSASVENDMSDSIINILGYRVDGGPFSNPYALDPGSTIGYVAYGGIPGIKYSLNGNIANTDFTVGGVTYAATVLNWTTPTWVIDFNGVLPIDVSATPIATPEPNSATLILTVVGLFALMILMRKRIGRGESRIEWKCSR